MKKIILLGLLLGIGLSLMGQQRISPAKQLQLAPDTAYFLLSDGNGELQFVLLSSVITGGGVADQDTLVDVGDGRFYYIDEGDTTIINTQADSNPITTNIAVGDSTYQGGNSSVQDLLIALAAITDSTIYRSDGSLRPDGNGQRNVDLNGQRLFFEDTGNGHVSIRSNREIGLFSIQRGSTGDSLVIKHDQGLGADYSFSLDGPGGQREIFSVTSTTYALGQNFTSLLIQSTIPDDNTLTKLLAVDPVTKQLKQVDISSISASSTACQDTISQTAHGFSLGNLIGYGSGNYFIANTSSSGDSIPVAFVCSVIDANTFTIATNGWIDWTHGLVENQDYWVQDDGSVSTQPDSDITNFAFRTFGPDKVYVDIAELIITGSGGGSGGSSSAVTVLASNGLFDADGSLDVDVEIGGPLEHNTTINLGAFDFLLDGNNNLFSQSTAGIRIVPNKTIESTRVQGAFLRKNTAAGSTALITYSPYGLPYTSPLTFDNNYKLRFLSDGTMSWARTPVNNNGIGVSSTFTGGEWLESINLGGSLSQNTLLDGAGFSFQIRDVPASNNYQYNFEVNPNTNQPYLAWTASSPAVVSGTQTSVDARFDYNRVFLQISDVPNSKNGIVEITSTQVRLDYEGHQVIVDDNGIRFNGVTEYASDAAADADTNLPAGGIYTVVGDRSIRIKP